jgi:hypothetical protein
MSQSESLFIRQLDAKRIALGLNNQDFAAYLTERGADTTPFKWSRLQNGKSDYQKDWARAVCRVWPELAIYGAADLLPGGAVA